MKEKLEPIVIMPLFQIPLLEVLVCTVSSLLTHVIVVPAFTTVGCTVPNNEFLITIVHGFAQLTAGPELAGEEEDEPDGELPALDEGELAATGR